MSASPKATSERFQYQCSTRHWVSSSSIELEETPCPAKFADEGGEYVVPCSGTLGEPLVSGYAYDALRGEVVAFIKAHRGTDTHWSLDEETAAFASLAKEVGL